MSIVYVRTDSFSIDSTQNIQIFSGKTPLKVLREIFTNQVEGTYF